MKRRHFSSLHLYSWCTLVLQALWFIFPISPVTILLSDVQICCLWRSLDVAMLQTTAFCSFSRTAQSWGASSWRTVCRSVTTLWRQWPCTGHHCKHSTWISAATSHRLGWTESGQSVLQWCWGQTEVLTWSQTVSQKKSWCLKKYQENWFSFKCSKIISVGILHHWGSNEL